MKAKASTLVSSAQSVLRLLLCGRRIQQGEGQVGRPSITHKNKTPQIAGSCRSAHWTAGDRGIRPIQARLLIVSRASSKDVQKSLAGLRVIHRWRVRPTSPSGGAILVNPGAEAGRAELERHHMPSLLGIRLPYCLRIGTMVPTYEAGTS